MKNIISLILLSLSLTLFSQNANLDGTWVGYLYDEDDELVNYLLLVVEEGEATQYGYNSETEEYYAFTSNQKQFLIERNNAIFMWMNQGGSWSETQTYHISMLSENKAEVIWTRQVNNVKEGENEVWNVSASGTMEKLYNNAFSDPYVEAKSYAYISIASVIIQDSNTLVEFLFTNDSDETIIGTFNGPDSKSAMYITDQNRNKKYMVTTIDGAEFGESFEIDPGENLRVTLGFEPIGDLRVFDLLEPGEPGTTWNFYGIHLK